MVNVYFVVSSLLTADAFLKEHISALSAEYDVSLVANTEKTRFQLVGGKDIPVFPVPVERNISPWRDLLALFRLFLLFRGNKVEVIHSVTPKAGLLAMVAGFFARIPVRIHIFTGQVWVTQTGIKRFVLKNIDRVIAACSTNIIVDSDSQRQFLLNECVVPRVKSTVLAMGSICGVNTNRFKPCTGIRDKIRTSINVPDSHLIFLFVGRLKKDKGIIDLAKAFECACACYDHIHLLVVGPDEENLTPLISRICSSYEDRLHFVGFTDVPEQYMAASDVFCLPSYREGFGSVIIEAASCGIPTIASRIYGITDAVDEGTTGLLHEPGNTGQIEESIKTFVENPEKRLEMGKIARSRAVKLFSQEIVTDSLVEYYHSILSNK